MAVELSESRPHPTKGAEPMIQENLESTLRFIEEFIPKPSK
jgi:hypothetical protein